MIELFNVKNILPQKKKKIKKNFLRKRLTNSKGCYIITPLLMRNDFYVCVAQLDRVTGYEPVGRGFESLHAHQRATL